MKSTEGTEQSQDMQSEYHLDYSKAKPNRFAAELPQAQLSITLDPDIAKIFTTSEAVNKALRTILAALPK
ncbi:MAG: hypothetical protein GY862_22095 [Gammaproteobacteria bacterium]|nr:hypothetical protein [Gammaproteobacteria bacterium]